jgi:KUP system potassium uptake protein
MSTAPHTHHEGHAPRGPFALLALGALGVVFGDIGTSPLYALQVAFGPTIGLSTDRDSILGILSMFIWALIIVVTIIIIIVIVIIATTRDRRRRWRTTSSLEG